MTTRSEINKLRIEIEGLKNFHEGYEVYTIIVDNDGTESEPEFLFKFKMERY